MFWFNGDKSIRGSQWTVAIAPPRDLVDAAHKWCREQASDGNFYHHYTNTRWWFEKPEDAVFFAMRWNGVNK
jgi:hypothetical protein